MTGETPTALRREASAAQKRKGEPTLALSCFTLAGIVRAVPWQYVLTPEGVIFRDGDSYSHMWRIWNAAAKGIPLSARDPFVNFPHGGEVLWSPAFDWILATCIRLLDLDQPTAEVFCAWVPLVLGATAVALAALVAARTFSLSAGWITGLMLAVLPGSFMYTQLGFLDHHAAISLIGTAMLGGAMWIVAYGDVAPRLWPILAGMLPAAALLTWAGALLHVGILQLPLLAWALLAPSRERASQRTLRLALAHAVTALLILPFSLREWEVFGNFSPLALTRFQPTFYGAGAIALLATVGSWRRMALGQTRVRRLVSAAAVALAGLALAFLAIPELAATLDRAAGWFVDDVEFMSTITELTPLFTSGGRPSWQVPMHLLSPLLFVFPLAMFVIAWPSWRSERWLLLFWTSAFFALSLEQSRFVNTFSIAFSIVWGGAIAALLEHIRLRFTRPHLGSIAAKCVAIAVAAIWVVPSWPYYERRLRNAGEAVIDAKRPARRAIARWLADSRPAELDERGHPVFGLLCEWSGGHEIRYYSGWAVHQDGFGPYVSPENVELASQYFEALDEEDAIDILRRMRTRYVIADFLGAGRPPYAPRSMARRLVALYGSGAIMTTRPSNKREWVPALARHRLLATASHSREGEWLYEVVPGAVIVGSATPGSFVSAALDLRAPTGPPRTWTTRGRVDANGRFRLRVPYATIDAPRSAVVPLGPYRLRTLQGEALFDVSEASVQAGATLAAPAIE